MDEPVARLRIELQDLEPKIWRRVDVPLSLSLLTLHDIIQCTMGWLDYYLFQFEIGDRIYVHPEYCGELDRKDYKASSRRLTSLADRGVMQFTYKYDFGDRWMHDLTIERIRLGSADVDYPVFVDGAGRCPPENCGGHECFLMFLEEALDPTHPWHGNAQSWYETIYGKPFEPGEIEERLVRMCLKTIALRRRGGLMSHRGAAKRRAAAAAGSTRDREDRAGEGR